jgi:hypothetical protein
MKRMRRFFLAGDTAVGDVAVCGMGGGVVCMVAEMPGVR